jgi:hypothetical protein
MNKIKNYIIISLILLGLTGLCTLFVYLYIKERNKPPYTVISTVTEIRIDTLKHIDSLYIPKVVYVEKPVYPLNIDTPATIEDYFTGKIYEYNYKDTNFSIHAGIMIHKNSLVSFIPEYEIYRKTITTTNTIEVVKPPKFALSIGGDVGVLIDSLRIKPLFFITASIQSGFNQYNVGYDPFNKAVKVGYKYTIIYK